MKEWMDKEKGFMFFYLKEKFIFVLKKKIYLPSL